MSESVVDMVLENDRRIRELEERVHQLVGRIAGITYARPRPVLEASLDRLNQGAARILREDGEAIEWMSSVLVEVGRWLDGGAVSGTGRGVRA